jgi:serine/threonine protein kinase/tetratricopeptide (TPR) repeat protein
MIGRMVSHYKILKKIGHGGMGTVYLADDTKLSRKVALKFLPRELIADPVSNERFKREARAAALLNNPHIITIHEINEYQGRSYIVMEYVEGISLKEKIEQFRLQPARPEKIRDIVILAIQICRGLEKAHQANIIHRDIKPGNILIDHDGQAIITDFGLAKLTDLSKLTRNTSTLGTVHYMSPENIEAQEVDCRSDIWSFGVVMYEMITGQVPFRENYLQALFYSILNEEPAPVSDFVEYIPAQLEKIVRKCMQKDRSQRYATISEVLSDLKQLKQDLDSGEAAVKSKKIKHLISRVRKKRKWAISLALSTILFLFILIPNPGNNALKQWLLVKKLPDKKYLAVLPLFNPSRDPLQQITSRGYTAHIIDKLTRLEQFQKNFWVMPYAEVRDLDINSIKKATQSFYITLLLTGTVENDQDQIIHQLNLVDARTGKKLRTRIFANHITNLSGLQDGIIQVIIRMLDIRLKQKIKEDIYYGGTSFPGAFQIYLQGLGSLLDDGNKKSIAQAIDLFHQAIEQDDSYDEAYAGLGNACLAMFKLEPEKTWLQKARSYCNQALKINRMLASVHITLGQIHNQLGEHEQAARDFQKALEINPQCYEASLEMANIYYFNLGESKKAEEAYNKTIKLRPEYWQGYQYLAYFYWRANRLPEAEAKLLKIIELKPSDLWAYKALFGIYNKRTDKSSMQKAQEIFNKSKLYGADAEIYANMGTNLYFQKRYRESRDLYAKAIELDGNGPRVYMVWGNLADSCRFIKGYDTEALNAYQTAVKIVKEKMIKSQEDASMHASLALYLSKLGDDDQAVLEINNALKLDPNRADVLQNSVVVFELTGKRDQALHSLGEYLKRQGAIGELTRDPFLAKLHQDPQFQKLVKPGSNHGDK